MSAATGHLLEDFLANPVIARHDVVLDQYGDIEISTGEYLTALNVTDPGGEPFTYDADVYAWGPDGGIIAEHDVCRGFTLAETIQAVADFLEDNDERLERLERLLEEGAEQ